ncbi:unnamed protein product, partial [Ectocarpus fasciculatus]
GGGGTSGGGGGRGGRGGQDSCREEEERVPGRHVCREHGHAGVHRREMRSVPLHQGVPEGVLMGIGVLWLNAMVGALTQLVADATMEEGLLAPSLHPHRLYPGSTAGHRCDICQQRIKSQDAKAWRCKLCDFDLCRSC